MKREEAEQILVKLIMAEGNPEYFIWKEISHLDNEELIEALEEMGEEVEIEEDE